VPICRSLEGKWNTALDYFPQPLHALVYQLDVAVQVLTNELNTGTNVCTDKSWSMIGQRFITISNRGCLLFLQL